MHIGLKITFISLLMLALTSPPLIFTYMDYIGRESRAFFFITSACLIFFIFFDFSRMRLSEIYVLILGIFLFTFEIYVMKSELSNIFSYYAVIFFTIILFKALRRNELAVGIFLGLWIGLAYVFSFAVIFSFILHQFTSFEIDLLNFSSFIDTTKHPKNISIFGSTQYKEFGRIILARGDGYFFEPSYAAIYFLFNILIAKNLRKIRRYKIFYFISVLAGILTFSAAFYFSFIIILFSHLKSSRLKITLIWFLSFIILLLFLPSLQWVFPKFVDQFLDHTSFQSRINTVIYGIELLRKASLSELFLGYGVANAHETTKNFSSGLMNLLIERGLLGLLLVFSLLIMYAKKNRNLILTCIALFLVVAWYKHYIFWFGIILSGITYMDIVKGHKKDRQNY